jgi:hypothetical protein
MIFRFDQKPVVRENIADHANALGERSDLAGIPDPFILVIAAKDSTN